MSVFAASNSSAATGGGLFGSGAGRGSGTQQSAGIRFGSTSQQPAASPGGLFGAARSAVSQEDVYPGLPKFRSATRDPPFACTTVLPTHLVLSTDGDMIIQLLNKEATIECTVNSHILKHASQVFNAMLSKDRFKEGTELSLSSAKSELYKLELHDDDASAMITILNVLHHRCQSVPKLILFDRVVNIAELSEKYCLYGALYPWAQLWMEQVKFNAYLSGYEDWLLVAWAFRNGEVFRELSRIVILESAASGSSEDNLLHPSLPHSVVGKIHARRICAVDSILAICTAYLKRYSSSDSATACEKPSCSTLMYGAVMKCLSSVSLAPEHHSTAKNLSVRTMVERLHNLRDKLFDFVRDSLCQPGDAFGYCQIHGVMWKCPGKTFHTECNFLPSMLKEVNRVVSDVEGLDIDKFESRKFL